MKNIIKKIIDILKNSFDNKNDLIYIIENANWSIKWDGLQITRELNNNNLLKADTRITHKGLRNKIIHFGSINTIISDNRICNIHNSNIIILTWFHVIKNDPRAKYVKKLINIISTFHTSSSKTKNKLIKIGIPENKIIVIPLGIDLKNIVATKLVKKTSIKSHLKIPEGKIIIGSFQKDGEGWGEGLIPKLIKGPDVFCDVIEKLNKKMNIFVLLTGPARGYVKSRLKKSSIPFLHKHLDNYLDIVKYYQSLDLYLITSREEGGPKAILESWAAGVPIVTTKVGMATDIVINNKNGILVNIEDVDSIANKASELIEKKILRENIINNALIDVKKFDWKIITCKYYDQIYKNIS